MNYVLARLAEPGTLRSLAVVFFALRGIVPDAALIQGTVDTAILLLGVISALMPEKATKSTAVVEQSAATAQVAAMTAASAVREISAVTAQANQIVDSARSLAGASNVVEMKP